MQAKGILSRGLAIMLALALSVTALAGAVYLLGTSQPVMLRLMQRYAPPEAAGLPEAEYPAMAEMITAYLRGERDSFQLVYLVDGTEYLAFHDYEQKHMADCLTLFRLCRTVLFSGLAVSGMLLALLTAQRESRSVRWLRGGLIALLALVSIVAVMAVIDFSSLFILFHKLAFTNDLWLLNPATDMLIRLMPTAFFVTYASLIGLVWLAAMAAAILATILLERSMKNIEEEK